MVSPIFYKDPYIAIACEAECRGSWRGGGGYNPISHQKFFQNPIPSWIFTKNPSQSYQNPSE